jgi:hypothetical protein
MSNGVAKCRDAALSVVWSQWSVLGGQVGGRFREARAIVDPEALILLSCALRDDEPRLWDLVGGLVAETPSTLSVQRTRNLAAQYPERVRQITAELAAIAVTDGKDARWKPSAGHAKPRPYREGKVYRPERHILEPPALMARLRLAFGVHARTDLLAFLLCTAPSSTSARDIAEATGYGPMPVRRALDAIATARLIAAEGTRPERYHAIPEQWTPLLGEGATVPPWRYWQSLFAFLAAALVTGTDARQEDSSPYLRSSDARRLVLSHRAAFSRNRIPIPEPSDYPGEEFLVGFERTLLVVSKWLLESV